MIVKMFMPRFAPMVRDGRKLQTIRPAPKRMPKVGDAISLRQWSGKPYRSKQIVLKESVVTHVKVCEIWPSGVWVEDSEQAQNAFAVADGFTSWADMHDWFESTHGLPFTGILIQWKP